MTAKGDEDAAEWLHVKLVRRGGFTGLPATYEVNTSSLAPAAARTFRELVRASGLLTGTPVFAERRFPQGRDLIEWEITASGKNSTRSVRCTDDALGPALEKLVRFVRGSSSLGT